MHLWMPVYVYIIAFYDTILVTCVIDEIPDKSNLRKERKEGGIAGGRQAGREGRRIYLGSQFENIVHHGGEGMMAEA